MYLVLCGVKSSKLLCDYPRSRMSGAILALSWMRLDRTSSAGGRSTWALRLRCAAPPRSSGHSQTYIYIQGRFRVEARRTVTWSKKNTNQRGALGGSAVGEKWRPTDPITPDYTRPLAGPNVITILGWIMVSSRDNWSIENTTTTTHLSLVASHPFHTPVLSAVSLPISHFPTPDHTTSTRAVRANNNGR
jgi:hypothetical protein